MKFSLFSKRFELSNPFSTLGLVAVTMATAALLVPKTAVSNEDPMLVASNDRGSELAAAGDARPLDAAAFEPVNEEVRMETMRWVMAH